MTGNHTLKKASNRADDQDAPTTVASQPAAGNHRVLRGVARWTYRIVASAVLALVLAAVTVLVIIPRATHGTALTVLTGSMTPGIPVGSVVIDRPVDPGTLKVGDVATYQKAPGVDEYITHRIVKIDTSTQPATFTFKGDANRGPDITPVPAGAIRGKVWFHVPYLGTWRDSISGPMGRVLVIAVVVLMLGGYSVRQVRESVRDRKAKPDVGTDPLVLAFAPGAFDSADPAFVAALLQGELEPFDGGFRLRFDADEKRREVLAELLAPYVRPSVDEPTVESVQGPVEVAVEEPAEQSADSALDEELLDFKTSAKSRKVVHA
ncbi:MAG TPA: signal peptidase I [Jatrophihabitantaceae bacterium]|nr:signal peptidase I [Jatrophihabitantaceae bacterium]